MVAYMASNDQDEKTMGAGQVRVAMVQRNKRRLAAAESKVHRRLRIISGSLAG